MARRGKRVAAILASILGSELGKRPVPGVSPFFQIGVAARGQRINIIHHDIGEVRFPAVARTYIEFELMCRCAGIVAEGSVA